MRVSISRKLQRCLVNIICLHNFMKERCCNILSIYFNTIPLECFVFHLGKTVEDVKVIGALICCSFFFYLDDEHIFSCLSLRISVIRPARNVHVV